MKTTHATCQLNVLQAFGEKSIAAVAAVFFWWFAGGFGGFDDVLTVTLDGLGRCRCSEDSEDRRGSEDLVLWFSGSLVF